MSQLDFDGGETPMSDAVVPPVREHEWEAAKPGGGLQICKACGCYRPPRGGEALPCPGPIGIFVSITGDFNLNVGDVWPDGDYPEEITSEAVAEVLRKHGRHDIALDWNLQGDYYAGVNGQRQVKVFDL